MCAFILSYKSHDNYKYKNKKTKLVRIIVLIIIALKLLNKLDFPLAAPSANPFGSISPTKPEHVESYFQDDIKMVLDGGSCTNGIESTIIGFENEEPIIYRLGALALEDIEAVSYLFLLLPICKYNLES